MIFLQDFDSLLPSNMHLSNSPHKLILHAGNQKVRCDLEGKCKDKLICDGLSLGWSALHVLLLCCMFRPAQCDYLQALLSYCKWRSQYYQGIQLSGSDVITE